MPRPQRRRRICGLPDCTRFAPAAERGTDPVTLSLDEYESIRLMDHEGLTHEQCAEVMQISRTTVTEIYAVARRKLAEAIVEGRPLCIDGGSVRLCDRSSPCGYGCCTPFRAEPCDPSSKRRSEHMKIAVTYENGNIFQHFGHTEQFKLYEAEDGKIVSSGVVSADGFGHGALAGFLKSQGVEALICGGIGGGAQMALREAGIAMYGGVSGPADAAAAALAAGTLDFNPDVHCDHHGEHHHGEGHSCGSHGCGSEHSCH